ncbi:MAG: M15 family metallopeptidase [Ignavibacteriales bacterium]|nr:MAG: M15 family metallopeptidase [Ignavibacteriales bacterium]
MQINDDQPVIDCSFTLEQALQGSDAPDEIINQLDIVDVEYFSFDGKLHKGQLVVHKKLVNDIRKIFQLIKNEKFPVSKVIPIVKYKWSDNESMLDNNTSAFNYRLVAGTNRMSNHSYGKAIDINPFLNPHIKNDIYSPKGSEYNTEKPGTIGSNHFLVTEFKKLGWEWGGDWTSLKDYQHFEKKFTDKK